jgi:hypothetical protein
LSRTLDLLTYAGYNKDMNTTSIAGTNFTVTHAGTSTFVYGPRGGEFELVAVGNAGLHAVVNCKTGADFRDCFGRAVRVMVVGDIIEAA